MSAHTHMTRALTLDNSDETMLAWCELALRWGDVMRAQQELVRVMMHMSPQHTLMGRAHYIMGAAHEMQQQYAEAHASYQHAARIMTLTLGDVHTHTQRAVEACAAMRQLLPAAPSTSISPSGSAIAIAHIVTVS